MMDLKQQLKDLEGTVPCAYADSEGYLTIATGRLVDKRKGGGLRPVEMEFMLDNDIAEKTRQVDDALPWAKQLNDPRRAVLIGMCFQMGIGNAASGNGLLGFANTLAAIRDGHYEHAAELMLQSRWAKQTPERARRLSQQLSSGAWQ